MVFLRAVRRPGPARARARSRAHRCSLVARVHVRRPSRHTLPRHSRARSCARDCASARLGRGSGVRGTHGPRTSRETKTHAPFGGLAGTHLVSAHTQTHQTPELTNTTRHHDKAKTTSQGARAPGTYTPPINRIDRTLRRPPEEFRRSRRESARGSSESSLGRHVRAGALRRAGASVFASATPAAVAGAITVAVWSGKRAGSAALAGA